MRLKKWIQTAVLILLTAGLCLFQAPSPAAAQSSTPVLAVTPAAADVVLGNTRVLSLYLTGGVNVNAFDVTVTYDSSLVSLVSWAYGGYLSNLWKVYESNTPGSLRLAAAQLATPGVTGSGSLLNLTFRGNVNGISAVTITAAQLADPLGASTYPTRQNGTLWIHADPALYSTFTLTGNLTLQGAASSAGVGLNLGYGTLNWFGPYSTVTGSGSPNINLAGVYQDTYRLTTAQARYLNLTAALNKTKSVAAGSTALNPLLLRGGNAVWQEQVGGVWVQNNVIDALDLALVTGQYGTSGAGLSGDVNADGRVDFFDLVLVAGNYGLTSETAYQAWTP